MDTLATTLLTTTIARLSTTLNLVDKIPGIDESYQQIEDKLTNAIAALEKALISIKTLSK